VRDKPNTRATTAALKILEFMASQYTKYFCGKLHGFGLILAFPQTEKITDIVPPPRILHLLHVDRRYVLKEQIPLSS
jgi:hypothetical protein